MGRIVEVGKHMFDLEPIVRCENFYGWYKVTFKSKDPFYISESDGNLLKQFWRQYAR